MTTENISCSMSMKECCRTQLGSNPQPPDHESEEHLTEPSRLTNIQGKYGALRMRVLREGGIFPQEKATGLGKSIPM